MLRRTILFAAFIFLIGGASRGLAWARGRSEVMARLDEARRNRR